MEKLELKNETVEMIKTELANIPEKYREPFNSNHEGYAVLLEEVRELENEVFFGEKKIRKDFVGNSYPFLSHTEIVERLHKQRIREEAIQVAAMAIRIIQELT